ncbi:MAG: helix-turn-helix transcriptional regulator [Defluviitaleaceae bacterium]|nr:helix-turn-helix transcriptional regulator [Defluviitaleaceae bacterium]
MPSFDVGDLLKRLRKQKKISQEELAFPIIDRSTLSKIEMGKATPHRKTLEFLFDRLGFDSNEFINHFMTPEDVAVKLVTDELSILLRTVMRAQELKGREEKLARVTALIQQLEDNHEYVAHPLNKQFILDVKARYAFNIKEDDKAISLAKEALEIVIPDFNVKSIADYYLNKSCTNMLNLLALIYCELKRYDEAIDILYGLKTNIDNTYKEPRVHAKAVSPVINNVARILLLAGRPQEAMDICEEGIKTCWYADEYMFYKTICWFQAKALHALGRTEEFIEISRKLYYAYDIFRREYDKNHVRDTLLAETGVDVASLPS